MIKRLLARFKPDLRSVPVTQVEWWILAKSGNGYHVIPSPHRDGFYPRVGETVYFERAQRPFSDEKKFVVTEVLHLINDWSGSRILTAVEGCDRIVQVFFTEAPVSDSPAP